MQSKMLRKSQSAFLDCDEADLMNMYVESKSQRKRAEEDAKIIQNRINLLKQEEIKAKRQIQDTRRKVEEVLDQKYHKYHDRLRIENDQLSKLREQQTQYEVKKTKREMIAENKLIMKEKYQMKKMEDVNKFKESLQEKKTEKENKEMQALERNLKNARIIKDQERRQKILKEARKKEREILAKIGNNSRNHEGYSSYYSKDSGSREVLGKYEAELLRKMRNNEPFEYYDHDDEY